MATLNDAFWHRGQRAFVGSRAWPGSGLVIKAGASPDMKTTAALTYTLAAKDADGEFQSLGTTATIDMSGLTASHTNNPTITVTDDSSTTSRIERQDCSGVVIATAKHAYIILTVDKDDAIRGYIGEIVATTATAKRPVLNLTDECAFGQVYIPNTSGSDFTIGTQALDLTNAVAVIKEISFIPQD